MAGKITVSLLSGTCDLADDTTIVVREAFLPLFVWPEVQVVRECRRELSAAERFMLEAAVSLGTFTADEIKEITSLPEAVVHRIARRLAFHAVMRRNPNGSYATNGHHTHDAIARQALIEMKEDRLGFLFLPRVGDLLAYDRRRGGWTPPALEKLRPVCCAPVPAELRGESRCALLQRRVRERSVVHLADDIVDVTASEDDGPIAETCPCFRCNGTVEGLPPNRRLRLHIQRASTKGRREGDADKDADEKTSVSADLSGADNLVETWVTLANSLEADGVFRQAWEAILPEMPLPASRSAAGSASWVCSINHAIADALAERGQLLTAPVMLSVADGEACVEVKMRFVPAGPAAAARFAVDAAVRKLLTATNPTTETLGEALQDAQTEFRIGLDMHVTPGAVTKRLWQLRQFGAVYSVRRSEDFCYA